MKFIVFAILNLFSIGIFSQDELPVNQLIDSTKKYWSRDVSISLDYANRALFACDTSNCITYGECLKNMGVGYYYLYKMDTAKMYYQRALTVFKKCNYNQGILLIFNNLGALYLVSGDREKSMTFQDSAYELAIELQDTSAIIRALSSMSNIQYDLQNYPKALEVLQRGLPLLKNCKNKRLVTAYHANIYSSYRNLNDYENWKKHINITSRMIHELKDSSGIARLYTNLAGGCLQFKSQWAQENNLPVNDLSTYKPLLDSIIKLDNFALRFFKAQGMKLEMVHIYQHLGTTYQFLHKFQTSTEYFLQGLEIALEENMSQYTNELYHNLHVNMLMMGNVERMDDYQIKFMKSDSEIIEGAVQEKMAKFEVKYQTLEKEREIERQRLTIEKQEAEHRKQVYFRNFLLVSVLLLLVLMLFVYKSFLDKKKRSQIVLEKNALLVEANEEIRAQNEEIQTQRDKVVEQKTYIEKQKSRLDDSIVYAQRIQDAVLPSSDQVLSLLNKYFVIFKPKDVVSGDFYWVYENDRGVYVAVADCTGHGVPGAFMSMLGISFLNEIVSHHPNFGTDEILNALRNEIILALRQKSDSRSQRDSLEISLMCIEKETNKCQWSGAGIPLWIVRKHSTVPVIEEYVADKMPVGIFHKLVKFTAMSTQLYSGDRVFMTTDGFADQFGGNTGKRYMTSNFKQKIVETSQFDIQEQKNQLQEELNNWMHNNSGESAEQIDDITVLCFEA